MVDACRHDDQIILLQPNSNPVVTFVPYVEISCPVQNVADLFVFVQMLVEEHLHLLLIYVAHDLWRNGNFIAVLVRTLCSDSIHII